MVLPHASDFLICTQRLISSSPVAAGIAEKQEVKHCAMLGKNIQGWELDPADATALYDATCAELDLMSARLAEIDRAIAAVNDREQFLQVVAGHLRYWRGRLDGELSFHAKKHLVRLFVERIEVQRDEVRCVLRLPFPVRPQGPSGRRGSWFPGVGRGRPEGRCSRAARPSGVGNSSYDNTQNNANHVHTVWRDFEGDWGLDLLRLHYETAPPEHGH